MAIFAIIFCALWLITGFVAARMELLSKYPNKGLAWVSFFLAPVGYAIGLTECDQKLKAHGMNPNWAVVKFMSKKRPTQPLTNILFRVKP